MSYTFVYNKKDGWWLKITTLEDLMAYWEKYDDVLGKSETKLPQTKEFGRGMLHANEVDTVLGLHARNGNLSISEAKISLLTEIKQAQYRAVCKGNTIYINQNGGWNDIPRTTEQFVHKSTLVFPDFKRGEIKIEKFPLGSHFYLFIDGVQIKNGEQVKWNTYQDAEQYAKQIKEREKQR